MEARVKKRRNSAAVRIPATVLAEAGVELDQAVEVREERGRIVIEPVRKRTFVIRQLIDAIRPENLRDPIEFGPHVGRETW